MHSQASRRTVRRIHRALGLLLGSLVLWAGGALGQGPQPPALGISQALPTRSFLRRELPEYRNFAFQTYTNYPNHAFPYADTPRAFYSSLGEYLITGYDLYDWTEERTPGLRYGTSIFKDVGVFEPVFDYVVVARDGYGSWGFSTIVGDGLIARFTPLTLSKVDLNGVRMDLSTPHLKFTGLGSRIERANWPVENPAEWTVENTHYADASTLLLGSRLQADIGALQLGLNGVNLHTYRSTQPGNRLKGVLRPEVPLIDWVVVRVSDDSPGDGQGGPLVQEMALVVNGEARGDLLPLVVRQQADAQSQVGTTSRATGEFRPVIYYRFNGYYQSNPLYYRGRSEIPLFADYLYRADHEAGVDVSANTNLEGLLASFSLEAPGDLLRADGDDQLIYLFDLTAENRVESVAVEALLANDYRVEVATLADQNPKSRTQEGRYRSTFYRTVLRAPGNVRDLSNLERVRFSVGESTALFTYSADMNLQLPGLEVRGEYARSAAYSRFPAQLERVPLFDRGARFADRGAAYYLNASHWFQRGRAGLEYFSIQPDFQTEMTAFIPFDLACCTESPLGGLANNTVYWELVQDNEDGDRYPDRRIGNILGSPNDRRAFDVDGVFVGQDEDRDGLPDTNRNANGLPDYEEPFLLYDVEPNDYVYGLDRNNNDEPDVREDDMDPDYPYDHDQRGYHLFGQLDLTRRWSVGGGRYAVEQIAGAGCTRSLYGLLSYERQGQSLRRLLFENHLRRVQDDIADEFTVQAEQPQRGLIFGFRGLETAPVGTDGVPIFASEFREDVLLYQDSYVNESYLEASLTPGPGLNVVQKLRLRANWQQGGRLPSGQSQRSRRLDHWTAVTRADYTYLWGKLRLQPQFKLLWLRFVDQRAHRALRSEVSAVPIFKAEYPLMNRTRLQLGIQGLGPVPYRLDDRASGRNSFERRTTFVTVTNRSKYFGYDLHTIVGFRRDRKEFDDSFRRAEGFDGVSVFVRALIGFTEYGRPI